MADADSAVDGRSPELELPDLSAVAAGYSATGFPEEFGELFADPQLRLLRGGPGRIVVFRNEDVRKIAAHPAAGNMPFAKLMRRSFLEGARDAEVGIERRPATRRFLEDQIFTANPPRHGPMRQILARQFMPKPVERLAQIASAVVEDLIDELAGAGEVDLATAFAEPLAGRFWQRAFGMTPEERDRTIAALRAMAPLFFITRTPAEIAAIERATADYQEVLATAVERSAVDGGNEALAAMKREFDSLEIEDKPQSFGFWVSTNVIDGFHTAAIACVNVLYALLRTPQALMEAREDGACLPGVLAEGLRMLAPVVISNRCALEDFEYAGTRIPEGTAIAIIWAAANRDPAVFENPNRYDLRRAGRTAMTFGGGVHICPGRYVGSMLVSAALKGLISPSVTIELVGGPPKWLNRSFMRWADRISVTIRRVGNRDSP